MGRSRRGRRCAGRVNSAAIDGDARGLVVVLNDRVPLLFSRSIKYAELPSWVVNGRLPEEVLMFIMNRARLQIRVLARMHRRPGQSMNSMKE